jgi:hypothetical protein
MCLLSPTTLVDQITDAGLSVMHIESDGADFKVYFAEELSVGDFDILIQTVSSHNGLTTVESLSNYLDKEIFPFVTNLIRSFAAENIALGITQAGKTGHVLSLFSKQFPVPSAEYPNSLKASFDTGSLYISLGIIAYILQNESEYDDLSPFLTEARLTEMYNKIAIKLGTSTI